MSPIFVLPERSSERDYVITDSVRSMCMYVNTSKKVTQLVFIHL